MNAFHHYFVHSFTIYPFTWEILPQNNYHLKLLIKLFSGHYPTKRNKTAQNVVCKSST